LFLVAADKWQQEQPVLRQALTAPIEVISLGEWQYQYFET